MSLTIYYDTEGLDLRAAGRSVRFYNTLSQDAQLSSHSTAGFAPPSRSFIADDISTTAVYTAENPDIWLWTRRTPLHVDIQLSRPQPYIYSVSAKIMGRIHTQKVQAVPLPREG